MAVKTTNNKNKRIKTEDTSSDNDEKIDFMAACDEARMHCIKHQVEEQKCDTYFKFIDGTITKLDNPGDIDEDIHKHIYIFTSTVDHLNHT